MPRIYWFLLLTMFFAMALPTAIKAQDEIKYQVEVQPSDPRFKRQPVLLKFDQPLPMIRRQDELLLLEQVRDIKDVRNPRPLMEERTSRIIGLQLFITKTALEKTVKKIGNIFQRRFRVKFFKRSGNTPARGHPRAFSFPWK